MTSLKLFSLKSQNAQAFSFILVFVSMSLAVNKCWNTFENEAKKISYQNNVFSLIRELMYREGVWHVYKWCFSRRLSTLEIFSTLQNSRLNLIKNQRALLHKWKTKKIEKRFKSSACSTIIKSFWLSRCLCVRERSLEACCFKW